MAGLGALVGAAGAAGVGWYCCNKEKRGWMDVLIERYLTLLSTQLSPCTDAI
jgi:hypothetical protein